MCQIRRIPNRLARRSSKSRCSPDRGFEVLESRICLTGFTGQVIYDAPSPIWFAEVLPIEDSAVVDLEPAPNSLRSSLDDPTWIVRLNADSVHLIDHLGQANDLLSSHAAQIEVIRALGLPGQLLVRSDTSSIQEVETSLAANPHLAYFDRNSPVRGQQIPDDPKFSQQYALRTLDAPEAWDRTVGSTDVAVGVIDSGVDVSHPDLFLNIWINPGEIPSDWRSTLDINQDGEVTFYDLNDLDLNLTSRGQDDLLSQFVSDLNQNGYVDGDDLLLDERWADGQDSDGNGFVDDLVGWNFRAGEFGNDPGDRSGHGTHVAGTIGAIGGNRESVTGINWRSSIVPLKFLGGDLNGMVSDAVMAINYATMMRNEFQVNIPVLNNSWTTEDACVCLLDAIRTSEAADILFVAAAGNKFGASSFAVDNDQRPIYPASFDVPNVISVAASNSADQLAEFSHFGKRSVDLAAPGAGIVSTLPLRDGVGELSRNGTSMAAAQVSGVAALVAAHRPKATAAEIRAAVLQGADFVRDLDGLVFGGRRLNALGALQVDTFAPVPELVDAPSIAVESEASTVIRINYRDDSAIRAASIDHRDIRVVTGGVGSSLEVRLLDGGLPIPSPKLAQYQVLPPGGSWDADDNGVYRVELSEGEVSDVNGNTARGTVLGSFEVKIGPPGQFLVDKVSDSVDADLSDDQCLDASTVIFRCSLRAAVMQANSDPGDNVIFLPTGRLRLTLEGQDDSGLAGDLDILDPEGTLTIRGSAAGKTSLDAGQLDRLFHVHSGASLIIEGVSLTGGEAENGGALLVENGGTLLIRDSTLFENRAERNGGALHVAGADATLAVQNSTVSSNTAGESGGGVWATASAEVTLESTTVAHNVARVAAGGVGGNSAAPSIRNSIVAGNNAPTDPDVSNTFVSLGYNLIGDVGSATGFGTEGDIVGDTEDPIDAVLSELRDNAGRSVTHVPLPGSPAIDNGTLGMATDQRGILRPQDGNADGSGRPDIGAVERYFAEIHGVKYHDLNENGRRDVDQFDVLEPGIEGWTIYLDLNENGVLNVDEPVTLTDADGSYAFRNLDPTRAYTVAEIQQRNWRQTGPVENPEPSDGNFLVNTENDSVDVNPGDGFALDASGKTSLRAAIMEANALSDTQHVELPAGNFSLPLGELLITDSLVIAGADPGATILNAGAASRIFHVKETDLQMEGVTLIGGRCMTVGICENGGAIFSTGFLDILNSEFQDNQAIGSGGAIYSTATTVISTSQFVKNASSASGGAVFVAESDLGIRDSEFSENQSQSGGTATAVGGDARLTIASVTFFENNGGISASRAEALVFNSTFSGNQEQFAIATEDAPLTIVNSTVTANSGGGVHADSGVSRVGNTIIAANSGLDVQGQFASWGHNLIGNGDTATGFADGVDGDLVGSELEPLDPRLGPLGDNGWFGETHALLSDSPAIDAGNDGTVGEVPAAVGDLRIARFLDQRNEPRFADGDEDGFITIDIGAYEFAGRSAIAVQTSEDTIGGERTSLRDAIIQANSREGQDTIILFEETYALTQVGVGEDAAATGDLDILDDLAIIGSGPESTTIDAKGIDRVFDILDANVTINGVTIRGGDAVKDPNGDGGGIHAHDATIAISHSTITSNSAVVGGGIYAGGGSVKVTDSLVEGNIAAASEDPGTGGGIYITIGTTLDVRGSVIASNEASGEGGGIYNHRGTAVVADTKLRNNAAGNAGAGVHNRGEMQILDSLVSGNASDFFGAGISNAGVLRIQNSLISDNHAVGFGGGVANFSLFELSNSTVSNNTALRRGGGIYVSASEAETAPLSVHHSTIAFNSVAGTENGGGVYVDDTTAVPVAIDNSIIASNAGATDIDGKFASLGHNLIGNPGTVTAFVHGEIGDQVGTSGVPLDPLLAPLADNGGPTFTHALLDGSPAIDAGSRDSATETDQRGFARPFDGDFDGRSRADIGAVEFAPSRPPFVVNSTDDTLDANPGDGIAADSRGMTTLRAAVMEANELPGIDVIQLPEGTIILTIAGASEDGALSGDLDVLDALAIVGEGNEFSTIIGRTGDRVFDIHDEDLLLRGIGIGADGRVEGNGGLLRIDGGSVELEQVGISGANASEAGGAIYATRADLVIKDSELTNTTAEGNGGSIYAIGEDTAVHVFRSGFFGNHADNGGAITVDDDAQLVVENSSFSENTAAGVGGAIAVNVGAVQLSFVTITSNEADSGGGISNFDDRFHISNSIVAGNTSSGAPDVEGPFESGGYNWISIARASSGFGNLDVFGSADNPRDPLLATSTAVNNGGPTRTHALLPESAAIDAANPADYPQLDQRTSRRSMDGKGDGLSRPDIGAYEYFAGFLVDRLDDSVDVNPGDGLAVDDIGRTSLRAAIMEANKLDSPQLVVLTPGTHKLVFDGGGEARGDIDIIDDLTLMGVGAGETIIDAGGIDRVFEVATGATVSFEDLGITGGHASGFGDEANGGGIYSEGVLNLVAVDVFSNHADRHGGGVANGSESVLNLLQSSIRSNSANRRGGGIHTSGPSNFDLQQSSVTDNVAGTDGGGLYNIAESNIVNSTLSGNRAQRGGGVFSETTIGIESSTVVRNSADIGGGIFTIPGENLSNTLVAENVAGTDPDVSGVFSSQNGNNLIGLLGTASGFAETDLVGTDTPLNPGIGPLMPSGSVTRLHKLLPGSIAIDAGSGDGPEAVDQRGKFDLPRIADGDGDGTLVIDIGAFELQPGPQPVRAKAKAAGREGLRVASAVSTQPVPKQPAANTAFSGVKAAGPPPVPQANGVWHVQPDVGEIVVGADFGNRALAGGITGSVFDDRDRDDFRSAAEPGLASWTVNLRNSAGVTLQTSETDANGQFTFNDLEAISTYSIAVQDQPQWISGRVKEVFVGAGEFIGDVNIGNRQVEITGAGAVLGGRVVLADNAAIGRGNRTVFADENNNGVLDVSEPFDITEADGSYQLSVDRLPVHLRLVLGPKVSQVAPAPETKFDRATQKANGAPFFVTTADIDLDGDQDLVLAQQETATLLLLINNGDGTFEDGGTLDLAANTYARTIAAVDLDGDNDLDLVAAGSSDVVSVFWNQGAGVFSVATPIVYGGIQASSLVTGDFDANSFTDVAVVSQFGSRPGQPGNVSILLNDGQGKLTRDDDPIVVGLQPFSIAGGVFDDDAFLDLAVVNSASQSMSILVNDQRGGFLIADTISFAGDAATAGVPLHVAAGRFNADAHLDLAVAFAFGTVKLLWGDGAGGFTVDRQRLSTNDRATSILAVDLNSDQAIDLVVTDVQSKLMTVFQNNGNGEFRAEAPISGVGPLDPPSFSVAAANLNGDAALDLVLAHTGADPEQAVSLLFNRIAPGSYVAATETDQFDFAVRESDSVPPTVAVDQLLTGDPQPELSGAIDDPSATVRIVIEGNEYSATNNGQGRWTLPAGEISPALGDGSYDVSAVATDSQGNVGVDASVDELRIDTKAPQVTLAQNSSVDRRPVLLGTVDDPLANIEVTIDPESVAAVGPLTARNLGRTWTLDKLLVELAPGMHLVRVAATDLAGNVKASDFSLVIRRADIAPSVIVNFPGGGEVVSAGDVLLVSWRVAGPPVEVDVLFSANGSDGDFDFLYSGPSNIAFQWRNLPAIATHDAYIKVVAHGEGGTEGVDVSDRAFTLTWAGDTNGDLAVNFADFLALSANFGVTQNASRRDGDVNGDGAINFRDFLILSANFGRSRNP